ncbi:rod shape-determining protein MreD [Cellvibrio sp. OA-2007]|uniref:rod shape-determining protein MreD n=1 Tax=Cellvibrio sp. OA-2007 TaxID=529823 RepID=UPI00078596FC|nr:rod shape-determining protein MreD [Cellvibrio sp. OA-2007]
MLSPQLNLYFIVALSFVAALILSVYPLPMDMRWWRPEFVLVVAIYWIFFMPLTISFTLLCALGLFQDLLEGVPFGQHSLGLIIVAYICILSYQRVRNFSIGRQSAWIFVLVGIAQLTDNWVQGMAGRQLSGIQFLYPAITSALLWPVCSWWLNGITHRYHH